MRTRPKPLGAGTRIFYIKVRKIKNFKEMRTEEYLKVRFMGLSNNFALLYMVRKTARTKKINLEFTGPFP